jgi:6-phosphogluconolactonase (cycloisomerase 2 family)
VAVLAIDAAGRPVFVGVSDHFIFRGADSLGVDPTGHFLLVANRAGPLQIFAIDQTTGKLKFVDNAPAISGVTSLAFAPR